MIKLVRNKADSIKFGVQCIICDSRQAKAAYAYYYNDQKSEILECIICGHLFIHPVPLISLDSRNMNALSDAEFFGSRILKFLHEKIVINKEIRHVKEVINNLRPSLLDIGCGTGWTTSIWQRHGFSVTGLEPSATRSQFSQEMYGINIFQGHIEDFQPQEKFEVIIMRHVLEHIEDVVGVLKRIRSFLKQEGVLVVVTPNINSIGRYIFKENWEWVLPWHLHFYTPKTLSRLICKTGYKKLQLYQMPSPLWYPASLSRVFGQDNKLGRFLNQKARLANLALFTPIILMGILLNLNDNMTLIAGKDGNT